MIPSGYAGELGVKGDKVECKINGAGVLPLPLAGPNRGACGGGGALRGGKVYACARQHAVTQEDFGCLTYPSNTSDLESRNLF